MNSVLRRLIATGTMLAILLVMVATVSYAWLTFSTAPELSGVQISLGGRGTILIAPDQTKLTEEGVYHYPGKFSDTLHFNFYEQYGYLGSLAGLSPVSTADGLHWYLPTFYGARDETVLSGEAIAGGLKPTAEFALDGNLSYANLTDGDQARRGSYVYLDFWAVSPAKDYNLRLAQGDEKGGSFVIDLLSPTEGESGGYTLEEIHPSAAASVRVGFLVNHNLLTDDSITYYAQSEAYSSSYTKLRGSYQEKGESILYSSQYLFTIYEPNADLHPTGENGTYLETKPLGWDGGRVVLSDVRDRTAVQLCNRWHEGTTEKYYIQEAFRAAVHGKKYVMAQQAERAFYREYLQYNLLPYIDKGEFIESTSMLYDALADGAVSADTLREIPTAGAATDVILARLEQNVPQRIRMFVWLEGQDADCVDLGESVTFALGMELAGSQVETNEKAKNNDN